MRSTDLAASRGAASAILSDMHRLSVSVQEDHLQSLVRSPLLGLAELIWNSLDADADNIEVTHSRPQPPARARDGKARCK
jgi:hypothetical protein